MYKQYYQDRKEGNNISYLQSSVTNVISVYQVEYIIFSEAVCCCSSPSSA